MRCGLGLQRPANSAVHGTYLSRDSGTQPGLPWAGQARGPGVGLSWASARFNFM